MALLSFDITPRGWPAKPSRALCCLIGVVVERELALHRIEGRVAGFDAISYGSAGVEVAFETDAPAEDVAAIVRFITADVQHTMDLCAEDYQ